MGLETLTEDAVFRPLRRAVRGEQVAEQLADAIALGLLADGERLPSEHRLASSLEVATATVRDGLSLLRSQDLVRTQRGRGGGSFVVAPAAATAAVLRRRLAAVGIGELRDLCEHFAAVGGAAARLAARRAGEPEIEQLRGVLDGASEAAGVGAFAAATARFHTDLAATAQSAQLTDAVVSLQRELSPLLALASDGDGLRAAAHARMARVLTHVAAADGDAARDAVEQDVLARFEIVRARRAGRPV